MGITTYENNVVTEEVTKSFSDFSAAATSKSVDIITLDPKSGVLSIEVVIENTMGGLSGCDCIINFGGDGTNFLEYINTSSFNEDPNKTVRDFITNPFLTDSTSSIIYSADMQSQGIGVWAVTKSARYTRDALAGAGTQSSAVIFNGWDGSNYMNASEEWDGTSWADGGSTSAAKSQLAGCGTQTAALAFGGYNSGGYRNESEEYNGASWSGGGNLNTARLGLGGVGTLSSALSFGGHTGSISSVTEEYNGASWIASGGMNVARYYLSGCGIQSAAMATGGSTGSASASTELYNGATWSVGATLNLAISSHAGTGTVSAALRFGGNTLTTEKFDGLTWIMGSDRNVSSWNAAGFGSNTLAMISSGYRSGGYINDSEQYNEGSAQNLNGLTSGSLTFKVKYIKYYS